MRRNEVMLDAFRRARVYPTASRDFLLMLVTVLERNSKPRNSRS